jgi:hypothetical protein
MEVLISPTFLNPELNQSQVMNIVVCEAGTVFIYGFKKGDVM